MKAYKVIEKKMRYGSNAAIWLNNKSFYCGDDRSYSDLRRYINKFNLKKYIPRYIIDTEVEAAPGSPGIMCFKEHKQAKNFIIGCSLNNAMIIEVNGRGIIHDDIPFYGITRTSQLSNINPENATKSDYGMIKYAGIITFKKVTVLS